MKYRENRDWDKYWKRAETNLFEKVCSFYRKNIIANSVGYHLNKFFPHKGTFVETGSGTSQSTVRLKKMDRKLIALDIAKSALEQAKKVEQIDECILGDIFKLPFENSSLDGIWNVGVMEHFTKEEIMKALSEFSRVLKKGSKVIMFWPPKWGPVNMGATTIEFLADKILKKKVDLFPDEINQYSSKIKIKKMAKDAGFSDTKIIYSVRDLFTHVVVVCRK